MLFGDLPLKHVCCGIRFYNADKTSLGTIFRSAEYGWYIKLYLHLEVCTVGDKIVIANNIWSRGMDAKIYTHTFPDQ